MIKEFDITPRKRRTSATILGGFLSILVFAAAAYFVYLIVDSPLRTKDDSLSSSSNESDSNATTTTNTVTNTTISNLAVDTTYSNTTEVRTQVLYRELEYDTTLHYPAVFGFDFAYKWSWGYDLSYLGFETANIYQVSYGGSNYDWMPISF